MNKAGLAFVLTTVSSDLAAPWFQGLVTGGQVKKDELNGASQMAQALATDVRNASSEKLEPLVSHFDDVLTKHSDGFNAKRTSDQVGALQEAQTMLGYVTMIMVKAKIRG